MIEHTYGDENRELRKSGKILNQFWWEGLLVTKESLAHSMKLIDEIYSDASSSQTKEEGFLCGYFPTSYNLTHPKEIAEFILTLTFYSKFMKSVQLDTKQSAVSPTDIFIVKSFQGKQSIDYPITSSIGCALRHLQTAPRLATRYVTSPLLIGDKKFDLRYYVAVKSIHPLVLARHKQYAVRIANEAFSKSETLSIHFSISYSFLQNIYFLSISFLSFSSSDTRSKLCL